MAWNLVSSREIHPRASIGFVALSWSLSIVTISCAANVQLVKPAAPLSLQRRVTALGVATAKRSGLAKRIATSRAHKGLARLLKPQAVAFEYRSYRKHSNLTLTIGAKDVEVMETSFDQHKGSWISRVWAQRSDKVYSEMQTLLAGGIQASACADHPDPSISLMRAENRALRLAIKQMQNEPNQPKLLSGNLSILALNENLTDTGAQVDLLVHMHITHNRPLDQQERQSLLEDAIAEYRSLQEWSQAIDALDLLQEQDKPTAVRYRQMGQLYLYDQKHEQAADAFLAASKLTPNNLELIQQEIDAAKRIPDQDRVIQLHHKLRRIKQKAKMAKGVQGKKLPKN